MTRAAPHLTLDAKLAHLCQLVAPDARPAGVSADDLAEVWRHSRRHGLRPLFARALQRAGIDLAPPMQTELLALSADSLRFTHALLQIQHAFGAHGIRVLGYKGPALAALLHGNVALREFLDIDILIASTDLSAATDSLQQLGYVRDQHLTEKQDRHFRATASNYTFLHRETGVSVELHWQIALRYSGISFDFEDLWERRIRADLGNGESVATFSAQDQLLILALHGARHFWESLGWVADIAYLLRGDGLDGAALGARARTLGLSAIVAWALRLAHECLGVAPSPIPADVSAISVERAVALSYRRINAQTVAPELTFAEHSAFAALLGSWPTQLAYFTRLLLTPGPTDWAEQALPERLHFAYPMLRISRMFRKSVRAAK